MINDKTLQFSDNQVLSASGASADYLDLNSDRDIGPGTPLWLVIAPKAVPTGTSPTISVSIQTDDNAGFASPETVASMAAVAGADFANNLIVVPWPFTNQRYCRVYYTLGGTTPGFTVDAFLTSQPPPNWKPYPDGI